MPDTIAILAPSEELVPIEELLELSANENITPRKSNRRLLGYTVTWEDVTLTIDFLDKGTQQGKIREFLAQADSYLKGRRDKKAQKIERRAEHMVQWIECTVEPDWDTERKAQLLVQGIMAYYDYALMFANNTVYNENGNLEVGHGDSIPKYWAQADAEDTIAANERTERSQAQLKEEGVPYIYHLRNLPDDETITLRSKEEVLKRAIALNLIARRADGESLEWYKEKAAKYPLEDSITEQETIFAEMEEPEEYRVIMFSQRIEASWTLLWALGFVTELLRPDDFCDAKAANELVDNHSFAQLLHEANLRPVIEIMDTLDLHFRYHWAVTDAELYGRKAPAKLLSDVVYQRHYALNWLTNYQGQAWDEVTADT
jgi:hypothetical protein